MADVTIDVKALSHSESVCLAASSLDLFHRILASEGGRDALDKKKKELAERKKKL